MKAESTVMPIAPYELTLKPDNKVNIEFFENVIEIEPAEEDEAVKYAYDYYRLDDIKGRPNLIESLESNYDNWVKKAKLKELVDSEVLNDDEIADLKIESKVIEILIELGVI